MHQIILGSIALSIIHALIPSHWLPSITIGKSQGWDRVQTLKTTFFAGTSHTFSTTIFGLMVSFVGFQLSDNQQIIAEKIVPLFLLMLGLWFIMQYFRHHAHSHIDERLVQGKSYRKLLLSLVLMMFLSPCFEINAYFLSAGAMGWQAVVTIILIYNILTIIGILFMVKIGFNGLNHFNFHWLEHNEQLITGITLIGLSISNFFVIV
jgi:putative Mn2+ efflux pump MntP